MNDTLSFNNLPQVFQTHLPFNNQDLQLYNNNNLLLGAQQYKPNQHVQKPQKKKDENRIHQKKQQHEPKLKQNSWWNNQNKQRGQNRFNHDSRQRASVAGKSLASTVSGQRSMVSNREEQKLSQIVIEWDKYSSFFKKLDKIDTDFLQYKIVPKKILIDKDYILQLRIIQNLPEYKEEHAKQMLLENLSSSLQNDNVEIGISRLFNVLFENMKTQRFTLVQFKEKPIEAPFLKIQPGILPSCLYLSSLKPYPSSKLDQLISAGTENLFGGSSGGLSSCIVQQPILQEITPPPTLDLKCEKEPVKNRLKLINLSPVYTQAHNLSEPTSEFQICQSIDFPQAALQYSKDLMKKNDSISQAYKYLMEVASDINAPQLSIDQLTLAIISNTLFQNSIVDEIKKDKDDIFKAVTRQRREDKDLYCQMRQKISKRTQYLLFNQLIPKNDRDDESDVQEQSDNEITENHQLSDIEGSLQCDETNIFNSVKYKSRSSQRAKQMWAWQALVQTFKESFQPINQVQEKIMMDENESPYTCMCCFLSYYENTNPIVYCDYCDSGVHQRCYGIEDLDEPFFCEPCELRKKRQDIDTPIKGPYSKISMVCIICNKSGGLMKCDSLYRKNASTYFHVFCIVTSSFVSFKNISTMKHIEFTFQNSSDEQITCIYCNRLEHISDGLIETCTICSSTKFHAICAWLDGCQFNFLKKAQKNNKGQHFYKQAYNHHVQITCHECSGSTNTLQQVRNTKWLQVERNVQTVKDKKRRDSATNECVPKGRGGKEPIRIPEKCNKLTSSATTGDSSY